MLYNRLRAVRHRHSSSSKRTAVARRSMQSDGIRRRSPAPAWLHEPYNLYEVLPTSSSQLQQETTGQCLPLLLDPDSGESTIPPLKRAKHIHYLHNALVQKLASSYVPLDASRPWQFYWCLCGLSALGQDVSQYRER